MTKVFPWSKLGYRKTCVVTSPCTSLLVSRVVNNLKNILTGWQLSSRFEEGTSPEKPLYKCTLAAGCGWYRENAIRSMSSQKKDLIFPNMMVFPLKTTSGTQDNRFFQLLSWSWLLCLAISPCPLTNCSVNWWSRVQILYGNSKMSTVQ